MKPVIGSGGGCFRAGAQIQLAGGCTAAIESLSVGAEVLAFDEAGEIHLAKVTVVHRHDDPQPILRVKFWRGETFITPNHWVLNQYGSFVEMGSLTEHDALVDGMGHLRPIIGAELIGYEPVYNLTVEPHHTFIADGVRVHNGGHRERFPVVGAGGGGKGGGGSQHVATEAPDSLRSRQYARVIDVVSEGEIVGLVNGLQSVFLNGTPLENPDGSRNFSGVTIDTRTGTQAQSAVAGFPAVENEVAVSTVVKAASPVVRQVGNINANAVRITISVPQLTDQNTTNGDLNGSSVSYAVDLQSNGGGFVEVLQDTISGKTTSRYQRNQRIELTGSAPWDIRIRRLTADSTTTALQNSTFWDSYTEIIDAKLTYPNSALVAMEVDSAQFASIPSRGYEIKGIKIRVPSNYDPETRIYSGTWDGTFTLAWSDNPAWIFYDMVTNARYGLGDFVDAAQIDKWALYGIGQYCDELVPDGFGGTEPRYTCNLFLQTRAEAYQVITHMASIFAGITYWSAGAITAAADKPTDAVMQFTPANVIDGEFNYSGTSRRARHTVALVTWNDPADSYRQKIEYVEDVDGIERYGIVQTEIVAFGCTSRGQAHRLGKRLLLTETLLTETISFKCGLDSVFCAPGDVIRTVDPVRSGVRMGGRVMAATTSAVTLDAPVTIEAGKTYTLYCVMPTGRIETGSVTNAAGAASVLNVASAFSDVPVAESMWVLSASDLVPEMWRVIGISEGDKGVFDVTALAYRDDKYAMVDAEFTLEPLPTSTLTARPGVPTDLVFSESLYEMAPGLVGTRAELSWSGNSPKYRVSYLAPAGNWVTLPDTVSASLTLDNIAPGIYQFSIVAINALGLMSTPALRTYEVYGKTAAPAAVADFYVLKSSGFALAQWSQHPDLDVRVGGQIVVRHSPDTVGATWANAYVLETFDGNTTSGICPLMTGTYFAKAIDSSGNYSTSAVSFVASEGMVTGYTTVASVTEDPAFNGSKTSVAVSGSALSLTGSVLFDSMTGLMDSWGPLDSYGGISPTGTYVFNTVLDCGTVATRRFQVDLATASYDLGAAIDYILTNIDDWADFDGVAINDCDITIYASLTNDNPAGAPTWGAWMPFFVSDFTCRAARFKAVLTSGDIAHNISVSRLRVAAKVPV